MGLGGGFINRRFCLLPVRLWHVCLLGDIVEGADASFCIANEEPGVMLPGHCFTIEVRTSFSHADLTIQPHRDSY